jgi:hypothetical protein
MFTTNRKSYYDYIGSVQDNRPNAGFNYEGQIFQKTLSDLTLGGDQNRMDILASLETSVYNLIEMTKGIRNFVNYRVPKNNTYVR